MPPGGRHTRTWLARALVVLAGVAVVSLPACESTQDRSARIDRERKGNGLDEKGVVVTERSRDVKVLSTRVLQDENGTAAVVAMRNRSASAQAQVPLAIDVRGAAGKSLFRNDQPGLEPTLVMAPLVPPKSRLFWVNDQVNAASRPRSVRAKVGESTAPTPRRVPRIELTQPRLERDPVSGVFAIGFARNRSRVEQRKLVVFAVARRGQKIVAAGRAQINRLKPGKRARFNLFFIGNPSGARLTVAAPPTSLG